MIRIKAVDAQNVLDVCELTTNQDDIGMVTEEPACRNAISIAEAKYNAEMYPNAIYNNNALIGFFMYKRTESHAETANIYRFMVDDRFQHKGLEKKALEYILRGLKIQGAKKVVLVIDSTNENLKNLCLSWRNYYEKIILLSVCLLLGSFVLAGCSGSNESFEEKSYMPDTQINGIILDVRDRKIEVSLSEDEQVHIQYSENSKEHYDISVSDENVLTMASISDKEWTDYIGVKPSAKDRKILLQIPDALLDTRDDMVIVCVVMRDQGE